MDKHFTEFNCRVDSIISGVKSMNDAIENAFYNKEIVNNQTKCLEYIKEQHCLQIAENQKHFTEQTNKLKEQIENLQACVDFKTREISILEEIVSYQDEYINACQRSPELSENDELNSVNN